MLGNESIPQLLSLGLLVIAFLFMGLAGTSFRIRAVLNKPAWGGLTKVFLMIGIIILMIGIVLSLVLLKIN